jgi:hypothetical protein
MDEYKKSLVVNWILLVIYSNINIYTVYSLSHSWPNKGSLSWFSLIFFCPPFLYHFVAISYTLAIKENFRWKKCLRLGTLIAGFLLAGGLLNYTQKSSLRKLNRAYFPMVKALNKNMPMPCGHNYLQIPSVVVYNGKTKRTIMKEGKPIGELWYKKKRFILSFLGGSVDIDGSTLFYDSEIQQWQIFHNDNLQMKQQLNNTLLKFKKCDSFE